MAAIFPPRQALLVPTPHLTKASLLVLGSSGKYFRCRSNRKELSSGYQHVADIYEKSYKSPVSIVCTAIIK